MLIEISGTPCASFAPFLFRYVDKQTTDILSQATLAASTVDKPLQATSKNPVDRQADVREVSSLDLSWMTEPELR